MGQTHLAALSKSKTVAVTAVVEPRAEVAASLSAQGLTTHSSLEEPSQRAMSTVSLLPLPAHFTSTQFGNSTAVRITHFVRKARWIVRRRGVGDPAPSQRCSLKAPDRVLAEVCPVASKSESSNRCRNVRSPSHLHASQWDHTPTRARVPKHVRRNSH